MKRFLFILVMLMAMTGVVFAQEADVEAIAEANKWGEQVAEIITAISDAIYEATGQVVDWGTATIESIFNVVQPIVRYYAYSIAAMYLVYGIIGVILSIVCYKLLMKILAKVKQDDEWMESSIVGSIFLSLGLVVGIVMIICNIPDAFLYAIAPDIHGGLRLFRILSNTGC